jgi:hypothetical protein
MEFIITYKTRESNRNIQTILCLCTIDYRCADKKEVDALRGDIGAIR